MLYDLANFGDVFASFDNLFNDARFSYGEAFPPKNVFFGEDGTCEITLALAGYSKDELTVKVEAGKIIVEGHPKEVEEKKGKYYKEKIRKADFKRVYAIDASTPYDYDNITVTFENGLLTITVPEIKQEEEKSKVIEIQ